jgi:5-methylthioadenosine/S-adenosylhomocysteine deaminase
VSSGLLLEGGFTLTLDENDTAGLLSVAIEDGIIAAVGAADKLRAQYPTTERVDCSQCVILPGLINAHLHPEALVLKGIVEEMDLHDWSTARRFNRALILLGLPEMRWVQRAAVRASLADALLSGTTCVATYGVTPGADEVTAEALAEFGMHGHVTIRDATFQPVTTGPAHALMPPRMYRLHAEEALTHGELNAAATAHARGERIVMHAAETLHRISLAQAHFGTTTVRLLERYGLLSPRMLLSHAVHVDDEESHLLAERGVHLVASPAAELKLADGFAPVVDYLARGIAVALGTDSAICNNGNDMFIECRVLGLAQKARFGAAALPASQVLRCATGHGAHALGEGSLRGAIKPGFIADLAILDAANARLQPLVHRNDFSNVAANVVYAATGQDVRDVMSGGRWLVRGKRLQAGDAEALWTDLAAAAAHLHDRLDMN